MFEEGKAERPVDGGDQTVPESTGRENPHRSCTFGRLPRKPESSTSQSRCRLHLEERSLVLGSSGARAWFARLPDSTDGGGGIRSRDECAGPAVRASSYVAPAVRDETSGMREERKLLVCDGEVAGRRNAPSRASTSRLLIHPSSRRRIPGWVGDASRPAYVVGRFGRRGRRGEVTRGIAHPRLRRRQPGSTVQWTCLYTMEVYLWQIVKLPMNVVR